MYYLYTFKDLTELRHNRGGTSSDVAATIMGDFYPLDEDYSVYVFDATSTLTDSPPEIIHPTDMDTGLPDTRAGRWIQIDLGSNPQVNSDWNAVSGVQAILNKPTLAAVATSGVYADLTGKPTLATVATTGAYADLTGKPTLFNGAYASLTGLPTIPAAQVNSDWNSSSGVSQILNKPTIPTGVQRTRVQTNTSGTYTWTFPIAYGAGVTPIIGAEVEDSSSAIWNVQITAISNTSATIQITKTTAVTVLGISVLGLAASPQAYIHITAIGP